MSTPTVEAAPTPTVETAAEASVATVTPTLTAEEALQQFVRCDRLLAKKSMLWGQAPGVIYSGNPQITGRIEPGDYVRFLTPPTADGVIRIKVFPHDDRVVGKSNNRVWISWALLTWDRSWAWMFTCEETSAGVAPTVETSAEASASTAPLPTALSWRKFTPAQVSEIDERMDEYIDREHAGAVLWTTDAEIRYNLCGALERLNFDWDLFVQSGESLRLQGEFTSEDWLLMRDLASYLMYLVQQPTMDAYMQSRRAGETTIPPMPTMWKAYCAHNLFKP